MQQRDRSAIRAILGNWAQWVDSRGKGALGYPRINLLARSAGRSSSTDHIPVGVQQAEVVDAVVFRLRQHDAVLWCVLMCAYIGDPRVPQRRRRVMGTDDLARAMCMCRDTVLDKVRQSEDWIADALLGDARRAAAARRDSIG